MAGTKETPRQKMIGMMYLVLTALLALNVSREVLQAFNNLTKGIDETIQSTELKINNDVMTFEQVVKRMNGDENAEKYWQRVQKAVAMSDELNNKIESLKKLLVEAENNQQYEGGPESYKGSNLMVLVDEENTDIASRFLADPNQPKNAYGKELKEEIQQLKAEYISLFSDLPEFTKDEIAQLQENFPLAANDDDTNPDPAKRNWEFTTFNNVPLGAALAILTKLQNDLRNSEAMVINKLTADFGDTGLPVTGLEAMVMPRSTNVPIGGTYEADIFLGAQIASVKPTIIVDGEELDLEGARAKFKATVSSEGTVHKPVVIKLMNPRTGQVEEYNTELQFAGFQTPAIVSADKMNVLYMDLENPVSVSVPGFDAKKVRVSLSPSGIGRLENRGNGQYSVTINQRLSPECKLNVAVEMPDGSVRNLKPESFRIKKVPKPYTNLNNKTGGSLSRGEISTIKRVFATMDEEFLFDGVRFKVTEFSYIYNPTRGNVVMGTEKSDDIPANLRQKFEDAHTGDVLTIYQVSARPIGFGSEVQIPGSITFTVK
ncbi:hypothetical protein GC194_06025 [bacterium]|nr:hypothetical protein [bacterium]